MSDNFIELHQVTTSRGLFPILSGFTLSVSRGQFLDLYGPTGCGKTTVLKVIAGLVRPAAGSVLVAGQDLSRLSAGQLRAMRRSFGFMSLETLPQDDETLENAVLLPALLAGYSLGEARRLTAQALGLCGLTPLASERLHSLSNGTRQLACLALALVHQPMLILADEPTARLDAQKTQLVMSLLGQYARQGGAVIAVSSAPLPAAGVLAIDMEKLHHA